METTVNGVRVIHKDAAGLETYKANKEREWRDSELERTDKFMVIPDAPKNYLAYRALLRDYPESDEFPNGSRPVE